MSTQRSLRGTLRLAALALAVAATPLAAQQTQATAPVSLQSLVTKDLDTLEEKFVGLLQAMPTDSLDWRPAEGVRSVRELFGHVAGGNYFLSTFVGAQVPADVQSRYANPQAYESIQDRAELLQLLRSSFAHARRVIGDLPDERLAATIRMFGQESTVGEAALLLATHNHEHLGQAIAYARSVGVTPPWSGN